MKNKIFKINPINATRSCASIIAVEIIWSGIVCHHIEENLNNNNHLKPDQHIEDFFFSDRNGLNHDNNFASATGTGTALTFRGSRNSSDIIFKESVH